MTLSNTEYYYHCSVGCKIESIKGGYYGFETSSMHSPCPTEAFEELAFCFCGSKEKHLLWSKLKGNHFSWFRRCHLFVWVLGCYMAVAMVTETSDM